MQQDNFLLQVAKKKLYVSAKINKLISSYWF